MPPHQPVPRAAALLGYAGLLPPLIVCIVEFATRGAAPASVPPTAALGLLLVALIYAALILSFLGGMWWGLAAARVEGERLGPWLMLAVIPSLWAFGAFLAAAGSVGPALAPRLIAMLLAIGLMLSLLGDRRLGQAGLVPGWWMRLRINLSCGLAALTLAAALLA